MAHRLLCARCLILGLALLMPGAAGLVGCTPPVTIGRERERQRLAQLTYPAEAPYGRDLDIVARRDGSTLTLINRTPDVYRDVVVWLNQQYVRDVTRISIGPAPGNRYSLSRFINAYEEPFPVGTLLAPDAAFPVVLTELYNPRTNERHRLLTWPDDATP